MNDNEEYFIRDVVKEDIPWIKDLIIKKWEGPEVVVHGEVFFPHLLPGFVAVTPSGDKVGLVTYSNHDDVWEIITLNSLLLGIGIGKALLSRIFGFARKMGGKRLIITTTNDNTDAIRFYQKQGYVITAIRRNEVEESRKRKPSIPRLSPDGIPIQDEIELELEI